MVRTRAICLAACVCVFAGTAAAGTLTLTWDPNTESDLAGYVVSIGTVPDQYTSTVDVGNQTSYQYVEPDSSTPYYFAVRAYNTSGLVSAYSTVVQSTPLVTLPSVTTGAATSITTNSATLNGVANPNGTATSGYFEYGATSAYGLKTPLVSLGLGTQLVAIPNGAIAGLSCSTGYNFRSVALNSGGSVYGSNAAFTTSPCPAPVVTTGAAISISSSGATLTSTVDTLGSSTTAAFQYGATTQYGSSTAEATINSGVGSVAIPTAALTCGALYHYRGVAQTGNTIGVGADKTFSTVACSAPSTAPTITGQPRGAKVFIGQTVQMSVQATGAQLTYQWYLGAAGVMIEPIVGATSAVFTTPPVTSVTSYWVRVSNPSGSVNSITATITLKGRR